MLAKVMIYCFVYFLNHFWFWSRLIGSFRQFCTMAVRKFKADQLFTGHIRKPANAVLVMDSAGSVLDIMDEKDAGDDVEVFKGMLSPGFINAHCHIELSHLKGAIPPATGLVNFVQQVMTKRGATEEEKQIAIKNAEEELYQSGTVAVGDICNTTDSLIIKQTSKLHWYNFIEVSGFVDTAAEKRFADAQAILAQFQSPKSITPHAPYSVSKTLFNLLNDATANQLITIHNQETEAENELYRTRQGGFLNLYKNFNIDIAGFEPTGKSSLQSWLPYFTNKQSTILVHNTFTNKEDVDFIRIQKYFCLCINANKYIEQKIPPIELLREKKSTIVVGTDSYASNWQLNMLEEIKTIQQETANKIPLSEVLQWATINGAKALQMDDKLGSFEKGKQPGIVLIDQLNGQSITSASTAKRIL
jgi:cytosine/adenosine deaminase-related metal-dependent hydrolase